MNGNRRATGRAAGVDAEGLQRRHQWTDGAQSHFLIAIDDDFTIDGSDCRGEEAGGGAGIAEEQRPRRHLQAGGAGDDKAGGVWFFDSHPHLPQSSSHQHGVLALERARQAARAIGEGGQQ
jgi:hypothetical protein